MLIAERFPAYAQSASAEPNRAASVRVMDDDAMPYEQCDLPAMVNTSNGDGLISEGFGPVRIRSLEGRGFAIEITEELSGLTITAVMDYGRPAKARAASSA
jgi:hypothetical protein